MKMNHRATLKTLPLTLTPHGSVASSRAFCMTWLMVSRSERISAKFLVPSTFRSVVAAKRRVEWLKYKGTNVFFWVEGRVGEGSATPCASPPPQPSIFPIILFLSTTLLTGMTGVSLNWPLTSQSHGSFLKENNCFFVTDLTLPDNRPFFTKQGQYM
jgi:hypothetical protein